MIKENIILYDSVISLNNEGHNLDYIENLRQAISSKTEHNATNLFPLKNEVRSNKLYALIRSTIDLNKILANKKNDCIVIAPNLTNLDWITLFLIVRRYKKIKFIVFYRRLLKKAGLKNFIIGQLFKKTIASQNCYVVSDSRSILRTINVDEDLFKIAIPPRKVNKNFQAREEISFDKIAKKECLIFSMVGMLREDKGIDHYKRIITETLNINENCFFVLHATCNSDVMKNKLADLKRDLGQNKKFFLIERYLNSDEYSWLLSNIDVLILPYDVDEYADGSSGPMAESVSLDKIVISTRLSWAINEFQDYKKIIWLESLGDAELKLALRKAIDKSKKIYNGQNLIANKFNEDWLRVFKQVGIK